MTRLLTPSILSLLKSVWAARLVMALAQAIVIRQRYPIQCARQQTALRVPSKIPVLLVIVDVRNWLKGLPHSKHF